MAVADGSTASPDSPRASIAPDYIQYLREATHQIRNDCRGASPYTAALLRLFADRLDSIGRSDADVLAAIGIALAVVGEHLRDAALRTT